MKFARDRQSAGDVRSTLAQVILPDLSGMREPPIGKRRRCPPEAAKRLRLLAKQGCRPKRIIADKLGSAAAARKAIMPNVEHRSHKAPNNRAENSHVPLRKRAR